LTEDEDEARQGSHSIKDLVGVTLSDALFEGGALNADANFFSNFAPLIEEMREYIDLSIEAAGIVKEGIVESLHPSPMNAVSIVPRGGRDGKILDLIESYRESGKIDNVKPDADKVREDARKDKGMTPEELNQIAEKLAEALAPSFASLKEALAPAVIEVVETEGADALEVAEALVEAFPNSKASRTRVAEAVKNGATVADAITAEKALVESVKADLPEVDNDDDGVIKTRESVKKDYSKGGWIR
jgi:hypothetical protein